MMPKDYEYLLVAANLAHFHKKWGFTIKMMKWKLFLEGHQIATINCDGRFEVYVVLPLVVLSLHHPLILLSHQLVVALPLLILLLRRTLVLLFVPAGCCVASQRPALSSSHHAALSSSCRTS